MSLCSKFSGGFPSCSEYKSGPYIGLWGQNFFFFCVVHCCLYPQHLVPEHGLCLLEEWDWAEQWNLEYMYTHRHCQVYTHADGDIKLMTDE